MLKVTFLLNILALTLFSAAARIYDDSFTDAKDFFFDNFNFTDEKVISRVLHDTPESGRKLSIEYGDGTKPMSCLDVGACQGGFATGTCAFDRGLYIKVINHDPTMIALHFNTLPDHCYYS